MKKIYIQLLMLAAMAVAGAAMTSCQKEEAVTGKFTMSVKATKGGGNAKALSEGEHTINATWAVGEMVTVYNITKGETLEGHLEAQSADASTTLNGTLTGTIAVGDSLLLKFLSPNYSTQDGTLTGNATSIDKVCDYAEARVKVSDNSGSNIRITAAANFTNQQAIVKFTLLNKANSAAISPSALTVTDGTHTVSLTGIPAATYTANGSGVLYVAFPAAGSAKTVTLTATVGDDTYTYEKSDVTFANGQYYEITVKMKKDASVTAPTAVAASLTYSGSAQTLFSAGSTTGGTMKYKVTTTNSKPASTADFKTTIDKGTNAGTYYLWYYVDGGDNYNTTDVNGTAVTKAIGKATATLTCSNTAISFSSSDATNSTKTKTGVSCTGGTINVTSANTGNCTVSYSSGTITVTRKTNSAFTNTQITVSVTPDGNHTAPSNVRFNVSAAAGLASSATSSDKGKLIGRDGKIYDNATDATNAGTTAVAKIIYIGTTGHATYNHGLALALTDEGQMAWGAAKTACNTTKNTSTPVTGATWLLASKDQWDYMMGANGAGSSTALRTGSNLQSASYWSSTGTSDPNYAWVFPFGSGNWYTNYTGYGGFYVRACLAF